MNKIIHALIPEFVIRRRSSIKRKRAHRRNEQRSSEEVFTDVYRNNRWGGSSGEFNSGPGTTDQQAVAPYLAMMSAQAKAENFRGMDFVDLGCGDFRIGECLTLLSSAYVGVDVVKPLIARNQALFGTDRIRFAHLDIVTDALPDGDVCFVRQVLQHLSNDQIAAVLPKLRKYKWVFISEHYPADDTKVVWNVDKPHGVDNRIQDDSGVYLTQAPFHVPAAELTTVLTVPGSPGVIRTFLYRPRRADA